MTTAAVNTVEDIYRKGLRTFTYTYAAIYLIAAFFIFLSYRASRIIAESPIGLRGRTYFRVHLAIIVIEVVLWVIIGMAAIRLKSYTTNVKKSADGGALGYISIALYLMLPYAVIFSMATTVKTLFYHTHYLRLATTITNLLPLLLAFSFSIYLLIGTVKLNRLLPEGHRHLLTRGANAAAMAIYIVATAAYGRYFYHIAPHILDDDGLAHFGIPQSMLLPSYLIPYAAVWFMGLLACLNLSHFIIHIRGTLYKLLFRDLYWGLLLGFIGTYLVQLFTVSTYNTNKFGMGFVVFAALLALLISGCLLILRGVNRLELLER